MSSTGFGSAPVTLLTDTSAWGSRPEGAGEGKARPPSFSRARSRRLCDAGGASAKWSDGAAGVARRSWMSSSPSPPPTPTAAPLCLPKGCCGRAGVVAVPKAPVAPAAPAAAAGPGTAGAGRAAKGFGWGATVSVAGSCSIGHWPGPPTLRGSSWLVSGRASESLEGEPSHTPREEAMEPASLPPKERDVRALEARLPGGALLDPMLAGPRLPDAGRPRGPPAEAAATLAAAAAAAAPERWLNSLCI
mmetsp:Transcript_2710/g.10843  ORF Transcript_2710/g.10843 Transcript_2710/m.10843 type:complete len:247 (-) Transcript_2710:8544-9284(-)